MNDDIRLAFAHPSERAAASRLAPCDRISLRDYVVEVEIGAFQQERGNLQRVRFNVVVEVSPLGEIDDDVDRILSYDRVTEAIGVELQAERINLLETLAARVAERILLEPQAERVFVRIEKLDRGPFALGVEIVRSKDGAGPSHDQVHEDAPQPQVVYLSNEALISPRLSSWIDQLEAKHAPVIFCVGAADVLAPQARNALAQRRIDLLAIEQNAWTLAARDRRCMVVGTRTELDWAAKNGQVCIWAPSKIVLDAVDGPSASPRDTLALVTWFASEMNAASLVIVGAEAPEVDIAVRRYDADVERVI